MNLVGKSREEIAARVRKLSREQLVELLFSLASVEPHFTPAEIAERSKVSKRTILDEMRRGALSPIYKRSERHVTAPASAVNRWRDGFRVTRGQQD